MNCEPFVNGDYCICRHCQQRMTPGEHRRCSREPYDGCGRAATATAGEELACRHRGAVLEERVQKVERKGCADCGSRGDVVAVFACGFHGRCTLRPWQVGQVEAVCRDCDDREG